MLETSEVSKALETSEVSIGGRRGNPPRLPSEEKYLKPERQSDIPTLPGVVKAM